MKMFCITIAIVLLCIVYSLRVQAQIPPTKLNQVELMKQFEGLWRLDISKDTAFFLEMESYGTGYLCSTWYTATGKEYREGRRLYGYDKKGDKYFGFSIGKESGNIGMISVWFISNNKCEGFNYPNPLNPENISRKFEIEVKPDSWYQINIRDNKPVGSETFVRVKNK